MLKDGFRYAWITAGGLLCSMALNRKCFSVKNLIRRNRMRRKFEEKCLKMQGASLTLLSYTSSQEEMCN